MQPVSEPVGRDVSTMVPDQAQLHTADGLPAFPPDQTERRQGDYSDEDEQVQPLLKLTIRIPFLHSAAPSGDAERVERSIRNIYIGSDLRIKMEYILCGPCR